MLDFYCKLLTISDFSEVTILFQLQTSFSLECFFKIRPNFQAQDFIRRDPDNSHEGPLNASITVPHGWADMDATLNSITAIVLSISSFISKLLL